MRILWAPWRKPYLEREPEAGVCILCQKSKEREDRKNLILYRGEHCFVLLNLFPYNNGHLMIAPYRHLDRLTSLNRDEMLEMIELAQRSESILGRALSAQGFNLGMNLGKVAGAGIADHIHLHMVPRWAGDTNFLPVLGEIKVISEDIDSTYQRLSSLFADLLNRSSA